MPTPHRDVPWAQRRGQYGVVEARVLQLENTSNVEEKTAPFIAEDARSAGATKAA